MSNTTKVSRILNGTGQWKCSRVQKPRTVWLLWLKVSLSWLFPQSPQQTGWSSGWLFHFTSHCVFLTGVYRSWVVIVAQTCFTRFSVLLQWKISFLTSWRSSSVWGWTASSSFCVQMCTDQYVNIVWGCLNKSRYCFEFKILVVFSNKKWEFVQKDLIWLMQICWYWTYQ